MVSCEHFWSSSAANNMTFNKIRRQRSWNHSFPYVNNAKCPWILKYEKSVGEASRNTKDGASYHTIKSKMSG